MKIDDKMTMIAPANGWYVTTSRSWDVLMVEMESPCNGAEGGMCFHWEETQGHRKNCRENGLVVGRNDEES